MNLKRTNLIYFQLHFRAAPARQICPESYCSGRELMVEMLELIINSNVKYLDQRSVTRESGLANRSPPAVSPPLQPPSDVATRAP